MYVLDTNAFLTLGHYYPKRFPSIWKRIDELVLEKKLWSVREVRKELERNYHTSHIEEWVKNNREIFKIPSEDEQCIVAQIFEYPLYQRLVKRENMLKGWPVADPFIVASAKVNNAFAVTQEQYIENAAKIPTVCKKFGVDYINMEQFLEKENLEF